MAAAYAELADIVATIYRFERVNDRREHVARARVLLESTDPSRDDSALLLHAASTCCYEMVNLLIEDGRSDITAVIRQLKVPAPAPPVTFYSRFSEQLSAMRVYLATARAMTTGPI